MKRRRILLIAAAVLVLVIGGLALAVALIPEERVAQAVAERAEAAIGQPVAIEGVGISLFPLPGVRLSGVSVGNPDSTALLRLDRAEVRVRILPLFQKRVVVRSLDLQGPEIAVVFDSTGGANFPTLQPDTTAGPSTSTQDVTFAVDRVRVSDGSIRYRNRRDSSAITLDGWSQELSVAGAVEQGELTSLDLKGWVAFENVDAHMAGAVLPARDLSLRVTHDAALDLTADRLDLRTLEVGFDGVTLAGSGDVEGVNSGRPTVHLSLAADGLDAARLMAWVPDSMRARLALPDGRAIGLQGSAAVRATVAGTVAPDTLPAVDGTMSLADVAVTAGQEALAEQVTGDIAFSLDSVVARFDGRALDEDFNAGVAVRNPASPLAVVALSGRASLGRLAELGLAPDTLGLAGSVRIDLRSQVPLRAPAGARATGTIDLYGVELAGLDPVVRVPMATARFEGEGLRIQPMRVELGPDRAPVRMDITAEDWIPALVDSTAPPPRVTVAVEADTLDLDALMGPSEGGGYPTLLFARLRDRPVDGRPVEEVAAERGLAVPALPSVDARIEVRVDELVRNDLHYSDLDALALVTEDAATLDHLRFHLMGGDVAVSGRMEPVATDSAGDPVETRIMGRFGLENVGAGRFFDMLTPFRDHLDGQLAMAGTFGTTLDRVALPVRTSLESGGTLAIAQGLLANWAVLQGVAGQLKLASFDTLRFRDWVGSFQVDGPRVTLEETALQGASMDARASGWFDFGGQIAVQVTADLSPELARQAGAIGQQILAAAPEGRIPVQLRIQGAVERPDVSLDLSSVSGAVTARAREAAQGAAQQAEEEVRGAVQEATDTVRARAEEEARNLAEQATGQAAARFELPDSLRELPADSLRQVLGDSLYGLLPDSVKLRADSLQEALQNALKERLRKLLPRRGGGGGDDGGP